MQKTKKNEGKLFWKCGLRFKEKMVYVSKKLLLEKNAKTKKNKKKKTMKTFTIFGRFLGQNKFFWQIAENTFQKQFFLRKFCLFLL